MNDRLREVLAYTLQAGGKRLRGGLVLWSCEIAAGRANRNAEIAAAAVEMVHTSSLVHDDLPAMDDDDLRRGLPTCHKAFDEAVAILAGDALVTLAFDTLASRIEGPEVAVAMVGELARAAGCTGMIAGQMADLDAEKSGGDRRLLESIHTNKTAKMFAAAAVMGGVCGGADTARLESLRRYGLKLGLGFQIVDDILDVSATSSELGKTAGKDTAAGKLTYPSLLGMAESRRAAQALARQAQEALGVFGEKALTLRELAAVLVERRS
jgi:geranylgeranyl diphosphate synthase type II